MRYLFVLVLGVVAGSVASFYLDRHPQFRPKIDDAIGMVEKPLADAATTPERVFQSVLAINAIKPCFSRNPSFDLQPPVWEARTPFGPATQARQAERPYPDLQKMPGLVKIEQILSASGSQRHHCAGTRISEHWFLTAAHCIRMRGMAAKVIDMVIIDPGEDVMQPETKIVPVTGAICHAAWYSETGKFDDDIALVHVSDVSGLGSVKTATLDSGAAPLPKEVYQQAYFAGWGKNGRNRFLQGGDLTITTIGETFILGDNKGEFAPCVGDSGGPLYVENDGHPRVVGVLSSVTSDSCPPFDRAFYTRVKTLEGWIRTAMKLCRQNETFVCDAIETET